MPATRKSKPNTPKPEPVAKFHRLAITGCHIQVGPAKVDAAPAVVEAMKALMAVADAVKEWARYSPVVIQSHGPGINIGDTSAND